MTPRTNPNGDLDRWLTPDPERGDTTAAYRWRKATGVPRVQVARALWVSDRSLANWESGTVKPRDVRTRKAYARYLKSIQPTEES